MTDTNQVLSWVVGGSGLLGRAVSQEVANRGEEWKPNHPIDWSDQEKFVCSITEALEQFRLVIDRRNCIWNIYWCAGIGTIGSSASEVESEVRQVAFFAKELERRIGPAFNRGVVFYSSSAGGVYGGSVGELLDERTKTHPNTAYGEMKVQCEDLLKELSRKSALRVVIGRISSIYGVGQRLAKQQGLITVACLSILKHQTFNVYVPLETTRNYIHVADAALMIVNLTLKAAILDDVQFVEKLICSQDNLSVASVIHLISEVYGRRPRMVLVETMTTSTYRRNFSLRSVVHLDTQPRSFLPPQIGISQIRLDLLKRLADGSA